MNPARIFNQLNSRELRTLILMGIISLCCVIGWLFFSPSGILAYYNVKKQLAEVHSENEQLKEKNRLLQEKIDKIQNDPAFLEQLARKDYNLLKKDELLFTFK